MVRMHRLVMVIVITSSLSVFAADKSGGCGPGQQVAKGKSLLSTTTAKVTNGILLPTYTGAITSGTMGCAPHSLVATRYEKQHFIDSNMTLLALQSAIGSGEVVAGLSQLYGCPESLSPAFGEALKNNHGQIFSVRNAATIEEAIHSNLSSQHSLKGCVL